MWGKDENSREGGSRMKDTWGMGRRKGSEIIKKRGRKRRRGGKGKKEELKLKGRTERKF